jgi:hypothetical protein
VLGGWCQVAGVLESAGSPPAVYREFRMSRISVTVLLIGCAVAASHQVVLTKGSGLGVAQNPAARPAVVVGVVVEGLNGAPVGDALVSLRSREGGSVQRTVTNPGGSFVFFNVAPGPYDLTVTKSGYASGTFGQRRSAGSGRVLALAGDRADLKLPVWKHAAVCGTLSDSSGAPLAGVQLDAFGSVAAAGRLSFRTAVTYSARTDDRGRFRIYGLAPGRYLITPRRSELHAASPPIPIDPSIDAAIEDVDGDGADVTVREGEERCGVDIRLTRVVAYRVRGQLTSGATAGSVVAQIVLADPRFLEGVVIAETTVDDAGTFVFPRVPAGRYEVRVLTSIAGRSAAGSTARTLFQTAPAPADTSRVTRGSLLLGSVEATINRQDAFVAVAPAGSVTVSGAVVFKGAEATPASVSAAPLQIRLSPADGTELPGLLADFVSVGPDGRFRIEGLPPGRYALHMPPQRIPPGWGLEAVDLEGRGVLDQPIVVQDRDLSDLTITLVDRPTIIAGTVRTSTGKSETAQVLIFTTEARRWIGYGRESARIRSAATGGDGSFALAGLPPGEYFVTAIPDEEAELWQTEATLTQLARTAQRIHLASGGRVDLNLPLSARR